MLRVDEIVEIMILVPDHHGDTKWRAVEMKSVVTVRNDAKKNRRVAARPTEAITADTAPDMIGKVYLLQEEEEVIGIPKL